MSAGVSITVAKHKNDHQNHIFQFLFHSPRLKLLIHGVDHFVDIPLPSQIGLEPNELSQREVVSIPQLIENLYCEFALFFYVSRIPGGLGYFLSPFPPDFAVGPKCELIG